LGLEKNSSADPLAALATDTARTRSAIERLQARLKAELAENDPSAEPQGKVTPTKAKAQPSGESLHPTVSAMSPQRLHKQSNPANATGTKSLAEISNEDTEEELERQLQKYFAGTGVQPRDLADVSGPSRDDLRNRVVDGVVRRILSEWAHQDQERPAGARLGNEIMERLIQRVAEQFQDLAIAS